MACFAVVLLISCYKSVGLVRVGATKSYLFAIFGMCLLFCCIQTGIQIYNLVSILSKHSQSNINTYAALNIFSIAADTAIMLILAMYWRRVKHDLSSSIVEQDPSKDSSCTNWMKVKTATLVIWVLAYLGYYIYFTTQDKFKIYILFGYINGFAGGLFLIGIATQMRRGLILTDLLSSYQEIVRGVSINRLRVIVCLL